MQFYKKCDKETRTFPEIWESLSEEDQGKLTLDILNAGCCKSSQSLWEWRTGKSNPGAPMVRDAIAKMVSKYTKLKTSSTTIFPKN